MFREGLPTERLKGSVRRPSLNNREPLAQRLVRSMYSVSSVVYTQ